MAESFFEKDQILEEDLEYVAAVFDGEGHFDIRTKKNGEPILKSICLKMSTRDMNVLARVKSILIVVQLNRISNFQRIIFLRKLICEELWSF